MTSAVRWHLALGSPAKSQQLSPGLHQVHTNRTPGWGGVEGIILVLLSGYNFDTAGLPESWPMWRLFIYLSANMHAVIVLPGEVRNLLHK